MTLGSPLRVGAPGLLANDSGVPGTKISMLDSDTTSWNNASVDIHEDGSFTYTPDEGDPIAGQDSFGYAIEDAE